MAAFILHRPTNTFIRYAVARFGAFSNITWDLGDDRDHYRDA
jgi:hypothetical protein